MLNTFSALHIDDVYLDLGNVDIYRGLARQAGLSDEVEGQLQGGAEPGSSQQNAG